MRPFAELRDAFIGWLDLIGRRHDAAESRFDVSPNGLVTMLLWYFGAVILTSVIQSLVSFGALPGVSDLAAALALNAVPMLTIAMAIFATARTLHPAVGFAGLFVPAGYALVLLLVIGLPLSFFVGSALAPALQGLLGYMLFRLARDLGKFSIGISVAFAILTVVLLVAIPIGLYMLLVPELPTPG